MPKLLFTNDTDFIIATDAEEAMLLACRHYNDPNNENEMEPFRPYEEDEFQLTLEDEVAVQSILNELALAEAPLDKIFIQQRARASAYAVLAFKALSFQVIAPASVWSRLPCGFLASTEY